MKKRAMVLGLMFGAALMAAAPVYAAEPEMTGAYEAYEEDGISEEAQAAFDQAMDNYDQADTLTPVQLVETQVVAGVNYHILCDKETEQGTQKVLLTIYKDLNGNCEVTDEQKVIAELDQTGVLNEKDFTVRATFTVDDFNLEDGTLTFTVSELTLYDMVDIAQMEVGDVFEVGGTYITVETMTEGEAVRYDADRNQTKVATLCVNEGMNTEYTFYAYEGGTWEIRKEFDWTTYTEIGEKTLKLSDTLAFTDRTLDPKEKVEVTMDNLAEHLEGCADNGLRYFNACDTTVRVENDEVVSIVRTWRP